MQLLLRRPIIPISTGQSNGRLQGLITALTNLVSRLYSSISPSTSERVRQSYLPLQPSQHK